MTEDQKPFNVASVDWMIRIGCLAILVYWTVLLVQPFLFITVWSIIIAVALYPIFDWTVSRLRLPRVLAAALITIICLLIVLGPATWLGVSLVTSLRSIFEQVSGGSISFPRPPQVIKDWPVVGESLYGIWDLASNNLRAAVTELSPQLKPLGSSLLSVAGGAGLNILQFIAAVAISGFLFVPGPSLVNSFKMASDRIATKRGAEFVDLAGATIRNLARGVIGISFLQALLVGIGLIAAGFPAAGLFSFLVLALGIIQIGVWIVLIPLIIWAWLTLNTSAALLFSTYLVLVSLLDGFLRPIVLGHGLKTPTLVILIGLIGGILAHGLIGLFIGPIVLAIAWELLRVWIRGESDDARRSDTTRVGPYVGN